MGLSTFHLVEIRTQYIDIWLLVTCLRTLTSLVLYQQPPCVCGSGPFYSVKPAQFHHSFTHHTISFSSNGVSPRKKTQIHPKKVENNPKPHICCHQSATIRYFLRPTLLTYSLLSSFPRPCLVVHPLDLLHVTTHLSHNVPLEMLPDLIMVVFRITHHTWKRLPVSMLTLVSQRRWQCTPQKANVQRYICKYIDELKRNERA